MEEKKAKITKFPFNTFNDKKECKDFIRQLDSVYRTMLGIHVKPVENITMLSNSNPNNPKIPHFREKCNEAVHFLVHKRSDVESNNQEIKKDDEAALFFTLNIPKIIAPTENQDSYLLNPELALLFLEIGTDPFKKNKDDANFEEIIDALYEGSEKFPDVQSRNCNNFLNRWFNAECNDIIRVRDAIKKLRKEKELQLKSDYEF